MTVAMHAKSDSEVTSIDASSPPRSPRRPLYFVQSPSQHDAEKMSYGWSPMGSPRGHYHCSPIHHSRESSSTTRFSASLKQTRYANAWKKINNNVDEDGEDEEDEDQTSSVHPARFYVLCFVFSFIVLFTLFSLILWGASKTYKPKITMESILFENYNIQAGVDNSGVPTDMLSLKSTVNILYRNPATFFGVHVTSTPLQLYYYQLKVASGHMEQFYQSRKSERKMRVKIQGQQVPLYGGVSAVSGKKEVHEGVSVPLNLTFVVRSRAFVLGKLVKPKFYTKIRCVVILKSNHLGKHSSLKHSCDYD